MRADGTALAISFLLMAGCGTIGDMVAGPCDDQLFYRGVRADAGAVAEGDPKMKVIGVADMPFSAIADTVLAPFLALELLDPERKGTDQVFTEINERRKLSDTVTPPQNQQ